jgi:hypothetical protein
MQICSDGKDKGVINLDRVELSGVESEPGSGPVHAEKTTAAPSAGFATRSSYSKYSVHDSAPRDGQGSGRAIVASTNNGEADANLSR